MNCINLYVTERGHEFVIPDDLFRRTAFRKDGLLDRRIRSNDEFAAYLALQEIADIECIDEYAVCKGQA